MSNPCISLGGLGVVGSNPAAPTNVTVSPHHHDGYMTICYGDRPVRSASNNLRTEIREIVVDGPPNSPIVQFAIAWIGAWRSRTEDRAVARRVPEPPEEAA